jgi:hypothetical protein
MRALVTLVALIVCGPVFAQSVQDLADVPVELRQKNWMFEGQGSCAHASVVTALKFLNMEEMAEWWRASYGGGEYFSRLTERLDAAGLDFVATDEGDERVLLYAARNRLVVVLPYKPSHAINLVEYNASGVTLIDNNSPGQLEFVPRAEFVSRWKQEFGGVAIVIIGIPCPPWPLQ